MYVTLFKLASALDFIKGWELHLKNITLSYNVKSCKMYYEYVHIDQGSLLNIRVRGD